MLGEWLNQPVVLPLAGRSYLCRTLTYGDIAMLLRNGGRALGGDPSWDRLREADWFTSWDGLRLVLWASIRRDEPGFTIADAEALATAAETAELAAVYVVAFPSGPSDDIPDASPMMAVLRQLIVDRGLSPDAICALTLPQVFLLNGVSDAGPPIRFHLPAAGDN